MKRCLFLLWLFISTLGAQTSLYVAGPSTGLGVAWTGITYTASPGNTTFLSDPAGDRQTGQSPDDFINTAGHPGFFIATGLVKGVPSVGFRLYLSGYTSSGYAGNLRVGIDANGDGTLDIFVGPKLSGTSSTKGIVFQDATGAGNYSPSTTSLGSSYDRIAFTSDNYNYKALNTTIDPDWVKVGSSTNSVLSFAIPEQTLKDNLAMLGIFITDQTYFNILAYTSTQTSSINQDIYGSVGIVAALPFDEAGGGFGDYYALDGSYKPRPVTPEPAMYGLIFVGITSIFVGIVKKKTSSRLS